MGADMRRTLKQKHAAALIAGVWIAAMLSGAPEAAAVTARASGGSNDATAAVSGTTASGSSAAASGSPDASARLEASVRTETELLAGLRALQLDIEREEADMTRLTAALADGKTQLEALEREIARETERYDANRDTLAAVLAAYQMSGPGSRLELLLTSDSLSTFLRRLSALRQLDRDTEALLAELEAGRNALAAQRGEKQALVEKLEQDRTQLARSLEGKRGKEAELETALAALKADRAAYEAELASLARTLDKAMAVFPELTDGFSRIITEGAFPPDALAMTFSLAGMTAVMQEDRFQAILDADRRLPKTSFHFKTGVAALRVESAELSLEGDFVVIDGVTLEFRPKTGSQGGLTLTDAQLADLSRNGPLQFRLEPILQGTTIRRIKLQEGQFILSIDTGLF